MAREAELLDPIAEWLRDEFGADYRLLIHQEAQGHGGRRVDVLAVLAKPGEEQVNRVVLVSVEIEVKSKAAIHDRMNGVWQLAKYPGHARYLAIPKTVARTWEARSIPARCEARGFGLLVVDLHAGQVTQVVAPRWQRPPHGLRFYPKTMERWSKFRDTPLSYRRISHRVISDQH